MPAASTLLMPQVAVATAGSTLLKPVGAANGRSAANLMAIPGDRPPPANALQRTLSRRASVNKSVTETLAEAVNPATSHRLEEKIMNARNVINADDLLQRKLNSLHLSSNQEIDKLEKLLIEDGSVASTKDRTHLYWFQRFTQPVEETLKAEETEFNFSVALALEMNSKEQPTTLRGYAEKEARRRVPNIPQYTRKDLLTAAWKDDIHTAYQCLWHNVSPNCTLELTGATPLSLAARRGNSRIVEILLRSGANVNQSDHAGALPLHWAAAAGNVSVVQRLLSVNPTLLQRTDRFGMTALHYAACHNARSVVEFLISKGCNLAILHNGGYAAHECTTDMELKQYMVSFLIRYNSPDPAGDAIRRTRRASYAQRLVAEAEAAAAQAAATARVTSAGSKGSKKGKKKGKKSDAQKPGSAGSKKSTSSRPKSASKK